jgi:hypothetical protein
MDATVGEDSPEAWTQRNRHRTGRRWGSQDVVRDMSMPPTPDGDDRALSIGSATNVERLSDLDCRWPKMWYFIGRSTKIARAEDELHKALSVSIIDDTAMSSVNVLTTELAHHYELPVELLELHHLARSGDFLLIHSLRWSSGTTCLQWRLVAPSSTIQSRVSAMDALQDMLADNEAKDIMMTISVVWSRKLMGF